MYLTDKQKAPLIKGGWGDHISKQTQFDLKVKINHDTKQITEKPTLSRGVGGIAPPNKHNLTLK